MCAVRFVKVNLLFPAQPVKHSFAVRMHKPVAFAKEGGHGVSVPCSCWILFVSESSLVQDLFA